jgi:hypothetical protein
MSMPDDVNLLGAADQVEAVLRGEIRAPQVRGFFGETTFTASYVAHDAASKAAGNHTCRQSLGESRPPGRRRTPALTIESAG